MNILDFSESIYESIYEMFNYCYFGVVVNLNMFQRRNYGEVVILVKYTQNRLEYEQIN